MPRPFGKLTQFAWIAASAVALVVACGGPKYPACDNDEDCNTEGHKGVCVNHVCVECRSDAACGRGSECKAGLCQKIVGYCDDSHACAGGGDCGKDHRCGPSRTAAAPPVECDDDHPCKGAGEKCQNGHCVPPPPGGPGCRDFSAPKFDFEQAELRQETRDTLQRLAQCLLSGSLKGRRVLLTGHCDARGEYEFNMGLGAERAEGVKNFLVGLGVPVMNLSTSSRGKLDANGTDEAGWANDRRVDIEVR
jgi:peptidoglycan-associated lipoprotein